MNPKFWAHSGLIAVGAALGANARYWLGGWIAERWGSVFPWGTLAVNASGSLLIGLVMGLAIELSWPVSWRLFLGIGLLGGYTTFSTFSYETWSLMADRSFGLALLNMAGSVGAGLGACWIGLVLARWITGA